MISPFVVPDIVRLVLPGPPGAFWIDVKRELTYGERQAMYARMRRQFSPGEMAIVDATRIGRARMEAFILGWSFVDPSGKPVPPTSGAFDTLTGPMADAIMAALEEHEEQVSRERAAAKNDPDGASVSSPISPSVS